MANQFGFSMNEDFLRGYAEYVKHLREENPGKSYKVVLTVDLIPDGIGYEITAPPHITIEEVEAEQPAKPHIAEAIARNQVMDLAPNEIKSEEHRRNPWAELDEDYSVYP